MTEPVSGFGGTALAPPPQTPDGLDFAGGEDGNRRKLLLVGAIVGVLIVAAAFYFLVLHKSPSTSNTFTPPNAAGAAPALSPSTAHGGHAAGGHAAGGHASGHGSGSSVKLPKVEKKPVGHNPFAALVVPPSAPVNTAPSNPKAAASAGSSPATTAPVSQVSPAPAISPSSVVTTPPVSVTTLPPPPTQASPGLVAATFLKFDKVNADGKAKFTIFYSNGSTKHYTKTMLVAAPSAKKVSNCNVASGTCGTTFAKIFSLIGITNSHIVSVQIADASYNLKKGDRISAAG